MSKHEHPLGISFEFFPPATDAGRDKLKHTRDALADRQPRFFFGDLRGGWCNADPHG